MSDSTAQQKKSAPAENGVSDSVMSAFEREMQKKIRNKLKKLEKIQELEVKVKRKEIVPNEEQLEKLASKGSVQAEIDDVKGYLTLYTSS